MTRQNRIHQYGCRMDQFAKHLQRSVQSKIAKKTTKEKEEDDAKFNAWLKKHSGASKIGEED